MENQRIRLSKAMLKTGLLTLLKEKPLNQISIYELCAASQINRTTFYKYYGSQTDLLKEIEADFFAQLDEDLKPIIEQNPDALISVLNHLHEQRELFPHRTLRSICLRFQASPGFSEIWWMPAIIRKVKQSTSAGLFFREPSPFSVIGWEVKTRNRCRKSPGC